MDLLEDLTVFVISIGEETYDDCLTALESQDCEFRIEHINNVSPMSAAFQAMPDRCSTKFFVQVDADMILDPAAIRKLYLSTLQSPFWVYRVSAPLYEEGFGVGGAVKCWKKNIFRFTKFHDVRTVDRDLHRRLRQVGFRLRHLNSVVGIHRPRHSSFSRYLKTKSDIEKWRFLYRPSGLYAEPLLDDVLSMENFDGHRLLGILLGSITSYPKLGMSKNISAEQHLFAQVKILLSLDPAISNNSYPLYEVKSLREKFITAYNEFTGRNNKPRYAVAAAIVEMYSSTDLQINSLTTRLIELIDR